MKLPLLPVPLEYSNTIAVLENIAKWEWLVSLLLSNAFRDMILLFLNIRFYILVISFLLSIIENLLVKFFVTDANKQISVLVPLFAYTALFYLYLTLLAGPLTKLLLWLPFRGAYIKARRALGVSVLYFSLLHAGFAFFPFLGGFAVLPVLSFIYWIAFFFSGTALFILTLMTITSFDYMIQKLTFPKWKMLHRFVYIAAIFILIHATLIGTRFQEFLVIRVLLGVGTVFLVTLHMIGLLRKYGR